MLNHVDPMHESLKKIGKDSYYRAHYRIPVILCYALVTLLGLFYKIVCCYLKMNHPRYNN